MSDELINYWPKYEYNPKDWKAEVERLTTELADAQSMVRVCKGTMARSEQVILTEPEETS